MDEKDWSLCGDQVGDCLKLLQLCEEALEDGSPDVYEETLEMIVEALARLLGTLTKVHKRKKI